MLAQLSPSPTYTNPECHNAQRHRQTDRQTDGQQYDANSNKDGERKYAVPDETEQYSGVVECHV